MNSYVVPLSEISLHDVERVGGKNASLGEMSSHLNRLGIKVPPGFATTASAFREFLARDGLDQRIATELSELDVDDVAQLARTGMRIRSWVLSTRFSHALESRVIVQ
jgi:pyruvate, water dikinase